MTIGEDPVLNQYNGEPKKFFCCSSGELIIVTPQGVFLTCSMVGMLVPLKGGR